MKKPNTDSKGNPICTEEMLSNASATGRPILILRKTKGAQTPAWRLVRVKRVDFLNGLVNFQEFLELPLNHFKGAAYITAAEVKNGSYPKNQET